MKDSCFEANFKETGWKFQGGLSERSLRTLSVFGAFFCASVLIHHWPEAIYFIQLQLGFKAIRMTKTAGNDL